MQVGRLNAGVVAENLRLLTRSIVNLVRWQVYHTCTWCSALRAFASTIGKKLFKQQYLLHMSSQCGEHWPTNWNQFVSLGHPT